MKYFSLGAAALGVAGLLASAGCVADSGYDGGGGGYYYSQPLPDPYLYDSPVYYNEYYVVPPPAYGARRPRTVHRDHDRYEDRREHQRPQLEPPRDRPGAHLPTGPVAAPSAPRAPRPPLPGIPNVPRPHPGPNPRPVAPAPQPAREKHERPQKKK
ncbi:hypothetical protein K0B96_02260 [Horticoccus luteus]|uniref:Uncharacterized protein n=1 Tax=Horticoccus luteus TaxID=2862869 RepID=A0A8F9TWK8_9BACT|nr:hypothetical protein [Horticoccus luteus]QYM79460.1 hypothetical protein K0B96_02260 [Horticoccus luteus]